MSSNNHHPWRGVPLEHLAEWQRIFRMEIAALKLSSPCPICGQVELYRYYDRDPEYIVYEEYREINGIMYRGRSGLWEWCHSCRHYEHMSAMAPEMWRHTLPVDKSELRHHPDAIDSALSEVLARGDIEHQE